MEGCEVQPAARQTDVRGDLLTILCLEKRMLPTLGPESAYGVSAYRSTCHHRRRKRPLVTSALLLTLDSSNIAVRPSIAAALHAMFMSKLASTDAFTPLWSSLLARRDLSTPSADTPALPGVLPADAAATDVIAAGLVRWATEGAFPYAAEWVAMPLDAFDELLDVPSLNSHTAAVRDFVAGVTDADDADEAVRLAERFLSRVGPRVLLAMLGQVSRRLPDTPPFHLLSLPPPPTADHRGFFGSGCAAPRGPSCRV